MVARTFLNIVWCAMFVEKENSHFRGKMKRIDWRVFGVIELGLATILFSLWIGLGRALFFYLLSLIEHFFLPFFYLLFSSSQMASFFSLVGFDFSLIGLGWSLFFTSSIWAFSLRSSLLLFSRASISLWLGFLLGPLLFCLISSLLFFPS